MTIRVDNICHGDNSAVSSWVNRIRFVLSNFLFLPKTIKLIDIDNTESLLSSSLSLNSIILHSLSVCLNYEKSDHRLNNFSK